MAQAPNKPKKKRNLEYPALFTAARTPLPPRVECAVFGCRNSDRQPEAGDFRPLPEDPESRAEWLSLINRRDLAEKRWSAARLCAAHFVPGRPAPALLLPVPAETRRSYEYSSIAVKTETIVKTEDNEAVSTQVEIEFEPEQPPAYTFHKPPTPDSSQPRTQDQSSQVRLPNQPSRVRLLDQPSQLRLPNQPSQLRLQNQPRQVRLPNQPSQLRLPNQPSQLRLPNQPSQLRLPNQPSQLRLPDQPSQIQPIRVMQVSSLTEKSVSLSVQPLIHVFPEPAQGFVSTPVQATKAMTLVIEPMEGYTVQNKSTNFKNQAIAYLSPQTDNNLSKRIVCVKVRPQPSYSDSQVHAAVQTDRKEAFYRLATFSNVEKINIPSIVAPQYVNVQSQSVHTQTGPELVEVFLTGIKRKFNEELEEANKKMKLNENIDMEKTHFLKACDKFLDERIASFVKSHTYLNDKFESRKYPADFKKFVLKLYLRNPQSYKFVEKFFDLPSRRIMERFHFPVTTGIDQSVMELLKVKLEQMSSRAKMCVVCFDVIRLTRNLYYDVSNDYLCGMEEVDGVVGSEPAEYAAVIMARGLYARWKQPVSIALLSENRHYPELDAWINKAIEALFDKGFQVKALVTRLEDEFLNLSVEDSQPYFEVNGQKIYHIYDVPHLIRNARDALMESDFHIGRSVAKWEHVLNVYLFDKQQELRLMPSVTDKHVCPDSDDVKLATQVFSKPVAAAMYFHAVGHLQPKQVKDTAGFMTKISNLLEILCSRTLDNAYRSSAQKKTLKDTLEWLKSIKVRDEDGDTIDCEFIHGLIISIKSVMALKTDLKKCNLNYILTKNLSQDCVQSFFDEVKSITNRERPTPIRFVRAYRRLSLVNLLKNTKIGADEVDMMTTLSKISEFVKVDLEKKEQTVEKKSLAVGVTDYKILWPSTKYTAGYLLWKCLERHKCPTLMEFLSDYYKEQSSSDFLQTFSQYNADNVGETLTPPPKQLINIINTLEIKNNKYFKHFKTDKQNVEFGLSIYQAMEEDSFEMPCPCFPISFLKMLYVRLKIYDSVKKFNKIMKNRRKDYAEIVLED